jgi:hypothetical protein
MNQPHHVRDPGLTRLFHVYTTYGLLSGHATLLGARRAARRALRDVQARRLKETKSELAKYQPWKREIAPRKYTATVVKAPRGTVGFIGKAQCKVLEVLQIRLGVLGIDVLFP